MRTVTEHTDSLTTRGCTPKRRRARRYRVLHGEAAGSVAGLNNSVAASENEQKRPSAADCSLLALAMRRD